MVALGATATLLVKVARLAQDPNSDLDSICNLLRTDGPLAADIIRISNSAYYASPTRHGTLNSAINYIGFREVVRVVNLSIARQLFARDLTSYDMSALQYWGHSVATATVMEGLAKRAMFNRDDAFTVGIMHGIGRVVINRIIQDKGYAYVWDKVQPVEEWERASVGFDFAETGAILTELWRFPLATCEIIRWQLDPSKVEEQISLLGALQFARRLIATTGPNFGNQDWDLPEDDPYLVAAGMSLQEVHHLIIDCEAEYRRVRQTLEI